MVKVATGIIISEGETKFQGETDLEFCQSGFLMDPGIYVVNKMDATRLMILPDID